jgi:DNA-binding MarR family transcriptional regulator
MAMNHSLSLNNSRSFIGKQADDLGQLIKAQIQPLLQQLGIIVPVKSCSIIHYLYQSDDNSLADLAKQLQQSHQLVKQKLPRLIDLGLVIKIKDQQDKRRTIYRLTEAGRAQAALLEENSLLHVYEDLSREIGANLYQVLNDAIDSLKRKDLLSRFEALKQQNNPNLKQKISK